MVIVEVVLETHEAVGFTAWPIAEPTGDWFLVLSDRMSPAEVGTAMAVILSYNGLSVEPVTKLTGTWLEQHLADAEALIAPGGLRFRDTTTNAQVEPGCCFGLENWRDWLDVIDGQELRLGHDPAARLEHGGRFIRLTQEGRQTVEISINELLGLLASAQQQLSGFLELARRWTTGAAPQLTVPLIAALDEHLKINTSI
ncbi:hypothetical protein OG884_12485 [Streptosporangium sp. NBC_01755]|uniref:hypothetical protein n=1 Tax=unclassified Streptosporangium TaxID=2632669 RepID=UPI002DD89365|nr:MULTISPECIES: hypothetical protein [unclassified Streptosporangium]WSA25934.1 hypothetical protein OIE13_34390 [Streptosporangium sp. NBC_01810]WSD02677.1 hypothetical protein OG884_12485 [Streptosporangium sp. NBC_01755]